MKISEAHIEAVNNLLVQRGFGSEMEIWTIAFGFTKGSFNKQSKAYIGEVCRVAGWSKVGKIFPDKIIAQYSGKGSQLYEKTFLRENVDADTFLSNDDVTRTIYQTLRRRHGKITAYKCFTGTGVFPDNSANDLGAHIRGIELLMRKMGWRHNRTFRKEADGRNYRVFEKKSLKERYGKPESAFADILG